MSTIARQRHAKAVKVHLDRLSCKQQQLSCGQETDNDALCRGQLPTSVYMRRWAKRQQQRINIETRAFWLRVLLEEITPNETTI